MLQKCSPLVPRVAKGSLFVEHGDHWRWVVHKTWSYNLIIHKHVLRRLLEVQNDTRNVRRKEVEFGIPPFILLSRAPKVL
jgi:hypothetical protein